MADLKLITKENLAVFFQGIDQIYQRKNASANPHDNVAVGDIIFWAGLENPAKFLECDGREIDVDEFSELFQVIGNKWGSPSRVGVFKIPTLTIGDGTVKCLIKAQK